MNPTAKPKFNLPNAPIIEAVIDFECDMRPGFKVGTLKKAAEDAFLKDYPKPRFQFLHEHQFQVKPDNPEAKHIDLGLHALQFLQEDEKQLIQIRSSGFSFNRLKPYSSLDDYLGEIRRTWELFLSIASPIQIRFIRLRYINRIPLPVDGGNLKLSKYIKVGPQLPDNQNLVLNGFLNQYAAMEKETKNQVNVVLTAQAPEQNYLPVIFDNSVATGEPGEPEDWAWIQEKIQALRTLKNSVFKKTLTEKCLNLFQ